MNDKTPLFHRNNYILLIVGFLVMVIGLVLMSGGGAEVPGEYSPEIFSFRRITLAPIVILLGLVINLFAILKNFESTDNH